MIGAKVVDAGAGSIPEEPDRVLLDRAGRLEHQASRRSRGVVPLALLVGAILLVGCGPSEEEQVAKVVREHDAAFLSGDARETCDSLTKNGQEASFRGYEWALSSGKSVRSRCLEAVRLRSQVLRSNAAEIVDAPEVSVEIVNPGVAEAKVSRGGSSVPRWTLRKVNGEWLIDSFGGR